VTKRNLVLPLVLGSLGWPSPSPGVTTTGPTGSVAEPQLAWVWSLVADPAGTKGLEVVDLNADGTPEIVVANDAPTYLGGALDYWSVFHYDGEVRQDWSSLPTEEPLVRIRSLTLAGQVDVAVATSTGLTLVDGSSRQVVRDLPGIATDLRDFFVADVDANGSLELLLCDGMDLRILDFETLAPLAAAPGIDCRALDVAQADADPELEILVRTGGGIVLDGISLGAEWGRAEPIGDYARFVDLDGDGVAELLVEDPSSGGLEAVEVSDGAQLWSAPTCCVDAIAPKVFLDSGARRLLVGYGEAPGSLRALDVRTGAESWSVAYDSLKFYGLDWGDLDGDGAPEAVFGTDDRNGTGYHLVVVDLQQRTVESETFDFGSQLSGVTAADVDGDLRLDLVTASWTSGPALGGGRLMVLDPATRALEYGQTDPDWDGPPTTALLAAQLDADPQLEMCTAGGDLAVCQDGLTHQEHWRVQFPGNSDLGSLAVTDVDGDGRNDVLVGARNGLVYALDGPTGLLRWRSPSGLPFGQVTALGVADVDGAPGEEIVALSQRSYDSDLMLLDPADGSIRWGPVTLSGPVTMTLAQLDADPELEIVLGGAFGDVSVLDLATGTLEPPIVSYPDRIRAVVSAGPLGGAGGELLIWAGDRLHLFDVAASTERWTSPFLGIPGSYAPLFVGNLDAAPDWEIVAQTWSSLVAFDLPFDALFADGFESGDTSAWSTAVP
jgi:outer membrane protein assembly factor BamB